MWLSVTRVGQKIESVKLSCSKKIIHNEKGFIPCESTLLYINNSAFSKPGKEVNAWRPLKELYKRKEYMRDRMKNRMQGISVMDNQLLKDQ